MKKYQSCSLRSVFLFTLSQSFCLNHAVFVLVVRDNRLFPRASIWSETWYHFPLLLDRGQIWSSLFRVSFVIVLHASRKDEISSGNEHHNAALDGRKTSERWNEDGQMTIRRRPNDFCIHFGYYLKANIGRNIISEHWTESQRPDKNLSLTRRRISTMCLQLSYKKSGSEN